MQQSGFSLSPKAKALTWNLPRLRVEFHIHDTYSNNFVAWSDATIRNSRFTDQCTNIMAQNTLVLLPQGETKTVIDFGQHDVKFLHKEKSEVKDTILEPGYNDTGLYGISFTASDILWYQLIPYC